MELGRLFGFLHPALVHFPLALLLVSVGMELIGFIRRDEKVAWAAQVILILGTVATLFAFVCGNFAEIWAARDGIAQEPMELHELYASITSWLFVFLAAGRLFLGTGRNRPAMMLYLACAMAGCVLLVVTGHKGAMLVYQHGAGVQLGTPAALPTHEDLAVLRQKQDPEALFYSNNMHHVFGWMVLILSGLLLADMTSPRIGARLRKVTPLLLLAGGLFLLIRSDTDSWPLSNQRPITDKEVLMHKTYAVLMLFFGVQGLVRRKSRRAASIPSQDMETFQEDLHGRKRQGRMMAVFSLVGGALLFTHVHSNAPYANVAVGVYLHHTVMGFIALCIGAVKLAEDATPRERPGWKPRFLAWAYPCLMLTESIFLLNYNEGLPWFLGYRNLSLEAPHHGLIAPLGRERAELVYHPDTTRMEVYLLRQADNRPYPIAADTIRAVARVGTESTLVLLALVPEPEGNYHFAGAASFLRGVSMFQTQALVNETLPGAPARTCVADFEPWTDERTVAAAHTQAAYVCPMHPSVGAGAPGYCGVCGMALVPNKAARAWNKLHDDGYHMDLSMAEVSDQGRAPSVTVTEPQPQQWVRLKLTPLRSDGTVVNALETVHTRKLHLIVVSRDLSFFDHVHPEPQPDGSLTLDYRFPAPGSYVLYADLTPVGDRNQVFALPVTVVGTASTPQPIEVTPAQAKVIGSYRVRMQLSPEPASPGDETQVSFTIFENGVPVTDLEPYLGAGGHCVALSQDARAYLHSHPLDTTSERFGPTVTFHTVFPKRGLYKMWGQFQHRGKLIVADFVVRVP